MSHITPAHPAYRSSTWGASNNPYFPNPSNRGACARFRMRGKVSRGRHRQPHLSATITAEQLLHTKTELYQKLNHLNEAVLQQAHALNEHVLSCTSMANTVADVVTARPSHPLVQPENNGTPLSRLATLASSIPSAYPLPSSNPSTSTSAPLTIPTPSSPCHDSLPKTSTGISSSLPQLRGFFNRSKVKPARG